MIILARRTRKEERHEETKR